MTSLQKSLPVLLVLASTYPRWPGDHEPGFVHELSKRLTDQFHVIVLGPHANGATQHEVMEGVEVIRYRYAPERLETLVNDGGIVTNLRNSRWKILLVPSFILVQLWKAWRIIRSRNVAVVHAHWLIPQGWMISLLSRLPGSRIPFVVTSHGADLFALRGSALTSIKRKVLERAAAATVVSQAMYEAVKALGTDMSKVSVMSMGVDMEHRFTNDVNAGRAASELLFVGRLVEKKGLSHLLQAMPSVLERRSDVTLTIAGFGPQEAELQAMVRQLGISSSVRFLGAVPQTELPALYRRATLFVAPFVEAKSGDQEGLGLVLVEALACGCPVLAGKVPAVSDVLGDLDGLGVGAVDPTDRDRLAERILDVLDNPAAAVADVQSVQSRLHQRFDWRSVSRAYARVLKAGIQLG